MKSLKFAVIVLFLFSGWKLFPQEAIQVEEFLYSGLIPVLRPIQIDSLDLEKKEYNDKKLLETQVDLDLEKRPESVILKADTSGIIPLEYAKDKAIQLLAFNIDVDRYAKAKLEITSTEMFEVYINGKKERSKESRESELSKSPQTELNLILEPQQYNVVIKLLAFYKNFNKAEIKVRLIPDKDFSSAQFDLSVDKKRRITIRDIIEGRRITDVKLSAGGNFLVATYETIYEGGKREVSCELWELKNNRLLYRFPPSVRPSWMPVSDQLYYWVPGVKDNNFYTFDPVTLEEKLICEDVKINALIVSPDESFMLIHQKDEIPADRGSLKRLLSPSDRSGAYRPRNVLALYNFKNKVFQKFSFGHRNVYITDISPDSKNILFMTTEEDLSKRLLGTICLYAMNLETLNVDTLANDRGISHAVYSPDGKQILIAANAEAFGKIGQNIKDGQISNSYDGQAFIMNLENKEIQSITRDFNPSITGMEWSAYDNKIYFHTEDEDREQVYVYDVNNSSFQKLNLKEDIVKKFQVSKTSPVAVYCGESVSNAFRLYTYHVKNENIHLLSDPFKNHLDKLDLGKVEDWDFSTSDGTLIKGRYYLPPDFDPAGKYPLIVYYYGGTSPTLRTFESRYPLHVYAANGYVVYTLQPSGTTGFGQEFSARHVNAWGKPAADEIIEGITRFCETHPFVNSQKVGCIGASYGGFMTQYLLTKTDIFSAAVSHAGISALSSYWGEGYWGYSYSQIASSGSYPWNNPDLYTDQSPLFHADKINTPLLLLHGSVDTNVPVGESIQMYTALKLLGKEVEFVQVEGENHAIMSYQKRIDWNKTIFSWFDKWLKDQPEWWKSMYPEN